MRLFEAVIIYVTWSKVRDGIDTPIVVVCFGITILASISKVRITVAQAFLTNLKQANREK